MRDPMHRGTRHGREDGLRVAAGDTDAVMDVVLRVLRGERLQPVMHRDALAKLAQLGARQLGLEFGLTDAEQLNEFGAVQFEVRKQTQLLEHVAIEILRLVQQEDRAITARVDREQRPLEMSEDLGLGRRPVDRHAEAQRDLLEQFVPGQRGIRDQRHHDAVLPLGKGVIERRGLAGADFTGDENERLAVLDPVAQVSQSFLMLGTRIHELRVVPCDERILAQPEVVFEHASSRSRRGRSAHALDYRPGEGRSCARAQPRSAGSSSPIENSALYGYPRCWNTWLAPWPRSTTASTRTTSDL